MGFLKHFSAHIWTIFEHSTAIHDTKSQSILWLKVNKEVLGFDFIIGAMYLPHEGSKYHSNDIFDNLNDDLEMLNTNYNMPICLMGDSNARTGLCDDFIDIDKHVAELTGIDITNEDFCDMRYILNSKGICTGRYNCDTETNSNGDKLIECCRTFGLRIVNGRFGADKNIGNFTCFNKNNGRSVVDYVIMSDSLLPLITDFEVDTYDRCLSDVHCPVNVCLKKPVTCTSKICENNKDVQHIDHAQTETAL